MLKKIKTLFGCFFSWKVKPSENLEEAEVFIVQSFGRRKKSSGKSNEELADEIRRFHRTHPRLLILQWEIANCLTDLENWIVLIVRKHLIVPDKYLDSREVKRQAAEEMKKRGWKTAVLFSQPWHNWRCKKVLEVLGVRVLIPRIKKIHFDWKSVQLWTKCLLFWIIREIPARLEYFRKKWI